MISKWNTKEKCQIVSLQYTTKSDFYKANFSAYSSARINGWLAEICSHMKRKKRIYPIRLTKEVCMLEAQKYKTKEEFYILSSSIYKTAQQNKWLIEICSHMKNKASLINRCVYSYEFSDNSVYIGLTWNIDRRQENRDLFDKDAVTKHIKETGLQPIRKILTDYIDMNLAAQKEGEFLNQYENDGWIILNKAKTGGLGSSKSKWTKNKLLLEAQKYKTRSEWIYNNPASKIAARNFGIDFHNKCCSHMTSKIYKYNLKTS